VYTESVTLIDEGDVIAFIDDLQFDYEGVHEITKDEESTIDWVKVDKAQVLGSLILLAVTHTHTNWSTEYRVADHVKVIVWED